MRRRWGGDGCGAVGAALGAGGVRHGQPRQVGHLRAMGFDEDHISDSRSLEFEDKFRAVTGGRGVDVVLDSLAGDFVMHRCGWLPPVGCFWRWARPTSATPESSPGVPGCALPRLRPLRSRTGSHSADACRVGRTLRRRRAAALPVTRFDVRRAPAALRYLSQPVMWQGSDDDAGCVGGGHCVDHRCHRMAGSALARHVWPVMGRVI